MSKCASIESRRNGKTEQPCWEWVAIAVYAVSLVPQRAGRLGEVALLLQQGVYGKSVWAQKNLAAAIKRRSGERIFNAQCLSPVRQH